MENVFVLPGVPSILQAMLPQLDNVIKTGKKILSSSIDTNLRESQISEQLSKLQDKYKNIDIGSYPYFNLAAKTGGVNIVVSSWDMKSIQPIVDDITKMIELNGGKSSIV